MDRTLRAPVTLDHGGPDHGAFAGGLLDPTLSPPAGIALSRGDVSRRYGIYRNNVTVSLMEALGAAYPVVMRLLGEACFKELSRAFVRAHPPRSPMMILYGEGFASMLAAQGDTQSLAFVADVARLERLWLEAYHAAEAPALGIEALASLDEAALAELRPVLHPSLRMLRSRYPVASIWARERAPEAGLPMPEPRPEDVLIVRPHGSVAVHRLAPGGFETLQALASGASLLSALEAAATQPDFDAGSLLAQLFGAGAMAGLSRPDRQEHQNPEGA